MAYGEYRRIPEATLANLISRMVVSQKQRVSHELIFDNVCGSARCMHVSQGCTTYVLVHCFRAEVGNCAVTLGGVSDRRGVDSLARGSKEADDPSINACRELCWPLMIG